MKSWLCLVVALSLLSPAAFAQDVDSLMKQTDSIPGTINVSSGQNRFVDGLMKQPYLGFGSIKIIDSAYRNVDLQDSDSKAILANMGRLRDDYFSKQKQIYRERQEAAPGKITALEVQKDRELEECRQGLFCSGCNETRSQILAKGEQFPHAGQHIIKATQDQLDAKAKEWDDKIARAKTDQQQAILRFDRLCLERNQIVTDTEKSVLQWKQTLLEEDNARATAWKADLDGYKKEVELTRQAIHEDNLRIAAEQAQGSKASAEQLTAYRKYLAQNEKHLLNIAARAGEAFAARKVQSEAFTQSLNDGLSQVGGILNQVGGQMLVSPSYFLGSATISSPSALPITVSASASGVSIAGNLGALRVSLSQSCDWLRDECKLSVTMASSLPFLSSFNGGIQQTTNFGANGVTQTVNPIVKAGPATINVDDLLKKDDSAPGSSGGKLP